MVVGLPYPNPSDLEIKERMSFYDRLAAATRTSASGTAGAAGSGQLSGRDYYDNLCMKAVNQGVGRVIRHRKDYAAILLVDERCANLLPTASKAPPVQSYRHSPGSIMNCI